MYGLSTGTKSMNLNDLEPSIKVTISETPTSYTMNNNIIIIIYTFV